MTELPSSMNSCRPLALAACGFLLLLLGACDDPSGVGLNVGPRGFQGGAPVVVDLEPTTFEATSIDDVTGNSARILAGAVDDPAVATTEAVGYLDVTPPSTLPDGFENATIQKAELVLTPTYVYGDTVQTQQLEVFEIPSAWEASGRTADETLEAGTLIGQSAPFAPGDTLAVELSDSWVSSQSLSDTTDFDANVHGFQFRASAGNAVVGYLTGASYLRVISTDQDTADYPAAQSFTSIARSNLQPHEDRVLVQDGAGQALSFSFTLPDSLQNAPISRAVLRLPTDTSLFVPTALPENFTRPQTRDLAIEGFVEDDRVFPAVGDSLTADGVFTFEADATSGVSLRQIFQQITLGRPSVERYRVTLSQAENTINPLLFYAPGSGEHAPRVSLTVTESED